LDFDHPDRVESGMASDQPAAVKADRPSRIPPRRWFALAVRGWKEASAEQVPLLAAGVAFYGFMALFPALIAFTLVWGLFADPDTIAHQTSGLLNAMPPDASTFLASQLKQLASAPTRSLGWGLVVTLVLALWSASGGIGNLVTAINVAYDDQQKRGYLQQKLVALGLTVGAVVFMLLVVGLVAVLPVVFQVIGLDGGLRWLAEIVRWLLLAGLVMFGLAMLYRLALVKESPNLAWTSVGAVVATVLWLAASAGFSTYVTMFGNYAKTYGALAGVVVMMLWLWITSYAVLLGAEINAVAAEEVGATST